MPGLPGRPRKPREQRKDFVVAVRFTSAELKWIQAQADRAKVKTAEWVRREVLRARRE